MRGMLFMDKIAIFFDRQNKHLLNWDANPSEDVLIRDFFRLPRDKSIKNLTIHIKKCICGKM